MADDRADAQAPLATLLGGIVSDAQRLVQQHLLLARQEVGASVVQARNAALLLALGAALGVLALVLFAFMLVYWLTNGVAEGFPLWACFGIVGLCLALAGSGLVYASRQRVRNIRIVPQLTAEAMKENLQWIKTQP